MRGLRQAVQLSSMAELDLRELTEDSIRLGRRVPFGDDSIAEIAKVSNYVSVVN